jgi:hypothetical protein
MHLGHRLGRRPPRQAGSDAEATVIVDPGHDLQLCAVVQLDAAWNRNSHKDVVGGKVPPVKCHLMLDASYPVDV